MTSPAVRGTTVVSAENVAKRDALGVDAMAAYRRLQVSENGPVTVVRFVDGEIRGEASIEQFGQELLKLVEEDRRTHVLLNFESVEYLSSAALVKLIALHKAVKARGGQLKMCNISSEFYEVFAITKLNTLFDIKEKEADALAAF
jgi:anti-sigma B factor antagonist